MQEHLACDLIRYEEACKSEEATSLNNTNTIRRFCTAVVHGFARRRGAKGDPGRSLRAMS